MNKLTLLVVGFIAGWLAEQIMGRNQTLIMNLVLGMAGAFLGSFLATQILNVCYDEGQNPATLAIAKVGALAACRSFHSNGRRLLAPASPLQARSAFS